MEIPTKENLLNRGYSLYLCIADTDSYLDVTLPCIGMKKDQGYIINNDGGYVCVNDDHPVIINKIDKKSLMRNFVITCDCKKTRYGIVDKRYCSACKRRIF